MSFSMVFSMARSQLGGLPVGVIDKFWQQKQLEIRAAQTAKAGSRKAQAEQAAKAARQETKLEAAWQEGYF